MSNQVAQVISLVTFSLCYSRWCTSHQWVLKSVRRCCCTWTSAAVGPGHVRMVALREGFRLKPYCLFIYWAIHLIITGPYQALYKKRLRHQLSFLKINKIGLLTCSFCKADVYLKGLWCCKQSQILQKNSLGNGCGHDKCCTTATQQLIYSNTTVQH